MRIGFHGAAGTVTGSRFLVESGRTRVLVDCGLFQGLKTLRLRNRARLPFEPSALDAVLLTHAHIDHSGFLPALVRQGFRGTIWCSAATRALCGILLPDSGRIQEEDARHANAEGFSKHHPAEPLYTEKDAERALHHLRALPFGEELAIGPLRARLRRAGHILGAASIELADGDARVLFSGDLGRDDDPLMHAPEPPGAPDFVVMESTYGDRLHPAEDPLEALAGPVRRTIERGGSVLVPSFAVGRTQAIVHALQRLFQRGDLPRVPLAVDSPMATDVTRLYLEHAGEHRLDERQCRELCAGVRFARSVAESKELDRPGPPRIVVSSSGMLTGGRVLHHVKVFGPDARNLILLPGFQAAGTRGAALAAGAREIKLHGRYVPIEAEVVQTPLFSAHADRAGLLDWIGRCEAPPRGVFLVHGEPAAADELRRRIAERMGVPVRAAEHGETVELALESAPA